MRLLRSFRCESRPRAFEHVTRGRRGDFPAVARLAMPLAVSAMRRRRPLRHVERGSADRGNSSGGYSVGVEKTAEVPRDLRSRSSGPAVPRFSRCSITVRPRGRARFGGPVARPSSAITLEPARPSRARALERENAAEAGPIALFVEGGMTAQIASPRRDGFQHQKCTAPPAAPPVPDPRPRPGRGLPATSFCAARPRDTAPASTTAPRPMCTPSVRSPAAEPHVLRRLNPYRGCSLSINWRPGSSRRVDGEDLVAGGDVTRIADRHPPLPESRVLAYQRSRPMRIPAWGGGAKV